MRIFFNKVFVKERDLLTRKAASCRMLSHAPHQRGHHAAARRACFDAGVELVPADAAEREYRERRLLAGGGEGDRAERGSTRLARRSEDGAERRVVCAQGGRLGKLGGGVRRGADELHSARLRR